MPLPSLAASATVPRIPRALRWRGRLWAMVVLLIVLGLVVGFSASVGSAHIPFGTVWKIMLSKLPWVELDGTWSRNTEIIVLNTRLPRIVLAGIVGTALAVAGTTYQGLFRNPLADPYLLGVSQGALLGAVIGFTLPFDSHGLSGQSLIPLFAFIGALGAVLAVYAVARSGRTLPVTSLILAGVAIGAFLAAVNAYLIIKSNNEELHGIFNWMLGYFGMSDWNEVVIVLPVAVVGTAALWLYARPLNVMQLDEEQAQHLGIHVERVKLILLIIATLMTAAAVAFVGTIGFVGIIVPHAVRLIWGPDHRSLLPLAALVGAIFLILTDTLSRTVTGPEQIPVGVITALAGTPFFLYLLRTRRRGTFF